MAGIRLTDEQVVTLRERYAAGERQVALAAEYGISQNTVSSVVVGRSRTSAGGPITRAGSRKLSPADVIAIREALAGGAGAAALAEHYGVSAQMVSNIATGRAHTSVGGPVTATPRRRTRPLTVEQVEAIKGQVRAGGARVDVATSFGISRFTVDSIMSGRITGRVEPDSRQFGADDVERMRTLYRDGTSQQRLAEQFGTDQQTVSLIVRGQMYASFGGPVAASARHLIPAATVTAIRESFAGGASLDSLAQAHDVDVGAVRQLLVGATYANVPGPVFVLDRRAPASVPSGPAGTVSTRKGHPAKGQA